MVQIYTKASLVISWLGPADKDSEIAISLIQRLVTMTNASQHTEVDGKDSFTAFENSVTKEELSIPDDHYKSLARFYARQYFFSGAGFSKRLSWLEICASSADSKKYS